MGFKSLEEKIYSWAAQSSIIPVVIKNCPLILHTYVIHLIQTSQSSLQISNKLHFIKSSQGHKRDGTLVVNKPTLSEPLTS